MKQNPTSAHTKLASKQKKSQAEPAPMVGRILKRDLDSALKKPFRAETCLLAQTATRTGLSSAYVISDASVRARRLMRKFDEAYGPRNRTTTVDQRALDRLRASLPITVKLTSVGRGGEKV